MVWLLCSRMVCFLPDPFSSSTFNPSTEIGHVGQRRCVIRGPGTQTDSVLVARHVPERISSQKVFFVIASLLQYLGADFGVSRLFTTFLLDLPNTRAQEKEGQNGPDYTYLPC